jgi:hypothetical protein
VSPPREAFVLPLTFLTVALLGGLRTGSTVRLLPPSLLALVLGMLLVACLVRARVLAPTRLMHGTRTPLENLSGAVVFAALFAASAQIFNLLTPDIGLLHVIFGVFFLVQLLTTLSGVPDRIGLLRSLTVLLGSAFLLRFLVLESLYAPDSGATKRVLTALMQGVTLGALQYEPNTPATGYAAFAALTLFLIGLVLLPSPSDQGTLRSRRLPPGAGLATTALLLVCVTGCGGDRNPGQQPPPKPGEVKVATDAAAATRGAGRAMELRESALRAARVWRPPAVPIPKVSFAENPPGPGGFKRTDEVACRFVAEPVGGTTPKFNCARQGDESLKVKYGTANPELEAEVAASRLLSALGFGADRMYAVRSVRCFGCPAFPFQALKCLADTGLASVCFPGGLDYSNSVTFDPAVIERRLDGTRIEAVKDQGWAWYELDKIDPKHGGSPRAEVDALKLMAVFLAHWDNKAENQRLVCLAGGERRDGSCAQPFAAVQDLGATFGPYKLDLGNWRATPVWTDPRACRVSMRTLPFAGATFPDAQISEEGRRLLLSLLEQLSDKQIRDLFTTSRVTRFDALSADSRNADAWLAAFRDKIRQIREAGPCPPALGPTSRDG